MHWLLLTLLIAAMASLATASHLLHDHNRPRVPDPPTELNVNTRFLRDFQQSRFNGKPDQRLHFIASIQGRDEEAMMKALNAIAFERRWFIFSRDKHPGNFRLIPMAVPHPDVELVRLMEADLADALQHRFTQPVMQHPTHQDMVAVRLRVDFIRPWGLIAWVVASAFAVPILALFAAAALWPQHQQDR